MTNQQDRRIPRRQGVYQTFQHVASVAEEIGEKAGVYRGYADRLQRLLDEQDVVVRG